MLSPEHVKQLVQENELLQVQLEELNMILSEREEELQLLKKNARDATELRSQLDGRLDELHSLQNHLGQKEQQALGAEEREFELQQELTEAARLQQQYNELLTHYGYIQAQLNDLQLRLEELNASNLQLQKIAGTIGEVESQLANTVMERDELKKQLGLHKDPGPSGALDQGI
jgi:chromosome segregation ATPase